MDRIIEHYMEILAGIGALVTAASTIVKLTPGTADDEFVGKLVRFLELFSIFNAKKV